MSARVAGIAAALDHVQQAVGVERVAARQRDALARGDRARVRRVGVERDHRARELESILRRLQSELRRLHAQLAQPRKVERNVDD